jgi:predicted  nucleic acid-binding Zn-ribbon protein
MVILVEDLGKFLGKTVHTPYNTPVGRLVGVDTNIRNEVTQVSVEQASGELAKYPAAQVRIMNEAIMLAPAWKDEAADLEREYLTASKRIAALKSLLSDGDIDSVAYRQMTSEYQSAIHAMESRRTALVDSLKEKTGKLQEEIRGLQLALTDNKLLYSSGVVEASTYKEACQVIHEILDGHFAEKKDIQSTIDALTRLEQSESTEEPTKPEHVDQKIPDFVVVKLREESPA